MRSRLWSNRVRTLACLIVVAFLLPACGQPPRRVEPDNLLWPLPPDQPRIRYVQSIYNDDDIGRVYSFRELLFGKDYADNLVRPYGVSVRKGRIYAADIGLRRIVVFDRNEKRMFNIGQEGGFQIPATAVADDEGTVYVADSGGGKIAVYDKGGTYRTAFPLDDVRPVGLALNQATGRLYVVDRTGHRVVVLGLDGKELLTFGERGTADGKFNYPIGVAIDRSGQVYVLDSGNFRVQIFTADGVFLSAFGSVGDRPGMFANPKGIALDSDGHIYVTDAAFSNFQIFDRRGRTLLAIGSLGSGPGYLYLPGEIAIDADDRIYVADQLNSRIQVFQYLKESDPVVR